MSFKYKPTFKKSWELLKVMALSKVAIVASIATFVITENGLWVVLAAVLAFVRLLKYAFAKYEPSSVRIAEGRALKGYDCRGALRGSSFGGFLKASGYGSGGILVSETSCKIPEADDIFCDPSWAILSGNIYNTDDTLIQSDLGSSFDGLSGNSFPDTSFDSDSFGSDSFDSGMSFDD